MFLKKKYKTISKQVKWNNLTLQFALFSQIYLYKKRKKVHFKGQSSLDKKNSKLHFFGISGLDTCIKDDSRSYKLQILLAFKQIQDGEIPTLDQKFSTLKITPLWTKILHPGVSRTLEQKCTTCQTRNQLSLKVLIVCSYNLSRTEALGSRYFVIIRKF